MLPASQHGAVEEYSVLWTAQKYQKQKRWQDGFARVHRFNNRLLLYDSTRSLVGDKYLVGYSSSTSPSEAPLLHDDEELELDKHLVQVQYFIRTENSGGEVGSGINEVRAQRRQEIAQRAATVTKDAGNASGGPGGVQLPRMDLHSRTGTPRLGLTPANRRRNPIYPSSAGAFTPVTPNVGRRLDYPSDTIHHRSAPTKFQTAIQPPKRTMEEAFGDIGGFDSPVRHKAPTPFRYPLDKRPVPSAVLRTPLQTPMRNAEGGGIMPMRTPSRAPTRTTPVYPPTAGPPPRKIDTTAQIEEKHSEKEDFDIELEDLEEEFGELEKAMEESAKSSPIKQTTRPRFKPPRPVNAVTTPESLATPSSPDHMDLSCREAVESVSRPQQAPTAPPISTKLIPQKAHIVPKPTTPIAAPAEPARTFSTARKPTLYQPRRPKPAPLLSTEKQMNPPLVSLNPISQQQKVPPAAPIPQFVGPIRNLSTAPKPTLRQPRPSRPKLADTPAQPENATNIISPKPSSPPAKPTLPPPSRHASPKPIPHSQHEIIHIPSQSVPIQTPIELSKLAPRKPLTAQESFDFNVSQEMDRIFDLSSETEALLNTSTETVTNIKKPQDSRSPTPHPQEIGNPTDFSAASYPSRSPTPHPQDAEDEFPDEDLDGEDWDKLADQLRAEQYEQEEERIEVVDMSKVEDEPWDELGPIPRLPEDSPSMEPEHSAPSSRFQNKTLAQNKEVYQMQPPPPSTVKNKETLLSRKPTITAPHPPQSQSQKQFEPQIPSPPAPSEPRQSVSRPGAFSIQISSPPAPPPSPPQPARMPTPPTIHILATKRKRRTKAEIERDKQLKEEEKRRRQTEQEISRPQKVAAPKKTGRKKKKGGSKEEEGDDIFHQTERTAKAAKAPAKKSTTITPKLKGVNRDEYEDPDAVDSDDAIMRRQRRLPREEAPEGEPPKKRVKGKTRAKKVRTPTRSPSPQAAREEPRFLSTWTSSLEDEEDTPVNYDRPAMRPPAPPSRLREEEKEMGIEKEGERHQVQLPPPVSTVRKKALLSRKSITTTTSTNPAMPSASKPPSPPTAQTTTPRLQKLVSTVEPPKSPQPAGSKPFRVPSLPLNNQINFNTPARRTLEQARHLREGTVDEITSTLMQTQKRREVQDGLGERMEEIEWSSDAEM